MGKICTSQNCTKLTMCFYCLSGFRLNCTSPPQTVSTGLPLTGLITNQMGWLLRWPIRLQATSGHSLDMPMHIKQVRKETFWHFKRCTWWCSNPLFPNFWGFLATGWIWICSSFCCTSVAKVLNPPDLFCSPCTLVIGEDVPEIPNRLLRLQTKLNMQN